MYLATLVSCLCGSMIKVRPYTSAGSPRSGPQRGLNVPQSGHGGGKRRMGIAHPVPKGFVHDTDRPEDI